MKHTLPLVVAIWLATGLVTAADPGLEVESVAALHASFASASDVCTASTEAESMSFTDMKWVHTLSSMNHAWVDGYERSHFPSLYVDVGGKEAFMCPVPKSLLVSPLFSDMCFWMRDHVKSPVGPTADPPPLVSEGPDTVSDGHGVLKGYDPPTNTHAMKWDAGPGPGPPLVLESPHPAESWVSSMVICHCPCDQIRYNRLQPRLLFSVPGYQRHHSVDLDTLLQFPRLGRRLGLVPDYEKNDGGHNVVEGEGDAGWSLKWLWKSVVSHLARYRLPLLDDGAVLLKE